MFLAKLLDFLRKTKTMAEPIAVLTQRYDEDEDGLLRSGLKLRHMRLIAALDEHGQISAAAQAMNISQPAASRMIAEMEDILGVPTLRAAAARHRADPLRCRARPPGPHDPARNARGRPRDLRPEERQGRLGVPRRGDCAGHRAGGAGDPHHPAPLSAHRDQRPGRNQQRAGARAVRLAPRFHHRAASPTTSTRGCSRAA